MNSYYRISSLGMKTLMYFDCPGKKCSIVNSYSVGVA